MKKVVHILEVERMFSKSGKTVYFGIKHTNSSISFKAQSKIKAQRIIFLIESNQTEFTHTTGNLYSGAEHLGKITKTAYSALVQIINIIKGKNNDESNNRTATATTTTKHRRATQQRNTRSTNDYTTKYQPQFGVIQQHRLEDSFDTIAVHAEPIARELGFETGAGRRSEELQNNLHQQGNTNPSCISEGELALQQKGQNARDICTGIDQQDQELEEPGNFYDHYNNLICLQSQAAQRQYNKIGEKSRRLAISIRGDIRSQQNKRAEYRDVGTGNKIIEENKRRIDELLRYADEKIGLVLEED